MSGTSWLSGSSLARLYPLARTLKAERQVCKLLPTLVPKEVGHAYCPCHSYATGCKVRPAVFQAGVKARAGLGGGGAAGARPTHGDCGVAGDATEPRAAFSALSSGAVVEPRRGSCSAGDGGAYLRATGVVVIGLDDTLDGGGKRGSRPKASIATRCAPRTPMLGLRTVLRDLTEAHHRSDDVPEWRVRIFVQHEEHTVAPS
jgi:hypothetical protein